MTKNELLNLKESQNIEFKKAKRGLPESFWETYSSFANTYGGIVYLGVDEENNSVSGVENIEKIRDDLFSTIRNTNKVSHNILTNNSFKVLDFDGLKVIQITIPEAPYHIKPIYLKNNPKFSYERIGSGDALLSQENYKFMVVSSQENIDEELLNNFDLDDLDEESIDMYRKDLVEFSNNEKYQKISTLELLKEVGAYRKDRLNSGEYKLTTGGLLFFGKINSIKDRFRHFQLDYFLKNSPKDIDWKNRISSEDDTLKNINVYKFYKLVSKQILFLINDEFQLDPITKRRVPYRSDIFGAVREAFVNMLMHAYYDYDLNLIVTEYKEYYEFSNPGKMRISVEEFLNGGISKIRNTVISSLMRRIGISEKAGSGGPRIFDVAKKHFLRLPEIKRLEYKTVFRIWKTKLSEYFSTFETPKNIILLHILNNGSISKNEALEKLKISSYEFRKYTEHLIKDNLIKKVGNAKATKYILNY